MVDLPITKWIKKKIRRLIAIVEDTDVATHSIASGKYIVWKGDLCKSTEAIAIGGSLSLSNLSLVSDGGLNELSEQIAKIGAHGTSGATASKVSIGNVSWTKVGQLVSLYIDCTATEAISSGDTILEGLPKSAINFPVVNLWNYSDASVIVANISNVGDLIIRTAIANGKKIRGNAVYLSQD